MAQSQAAEVPRRPITGKPPIYNYSHNETCVHDSFTYGVCCCCFLAFVRTHSESIGVVASLTSVLLFLWGLLKSEVKDIKTEFKDAQEKAEARLKDIKTEFKDDQTKAEARLKDAQEKAEARAKEAQEKADARAKEAQEKADARTKDIVEELKSLIKQK